MRVSNPLTLGELIKMHRERSRLKLTQKEVARQVGISDKALRDWESGVSFPSATNLRNLLEVYFHNHLFSPGHEQEEAQALWESRREADYSNVFPPFDTAWFNGLSRVRFQDIAPREMEMVAEPFLPKLPRHNLPKQLSSFIGREQELAEARELLAKSRLLTLTGAGGSGKTRFCLQLAAAAIEEFKDGIWFVDLAPVTDPKLIEQVIAKALEVKDDLGETLLSSLVNYLQARQLLLILDNCEHLIEESAKLVEQLLSTCPELSILITSREALAIFGETTMRLPTLSFPDLHQLPTNRSVLRESLLQYEAIQLFVERVSAIQPSFTLTEQNALAVAQVCYRLDGIPLALELAAARVTGLSIDQIANRLDDRFRLLTGGSRTALPRHQTLKGLIDWSHALLSEAEQILFRRLAIFSSSWDLGAAEAVCAGMGFESGEVLDLLLQLVSKSLVVAEIYQEQTRYHMLQSIRQYGYTKLEESNEVSLLKFQHLDYYLNLAEQAAEQLTGPKQKEELELLEREHDNLRTILSWTAKEQPEVNLRLVVTLWRFWLVRGYYGEGRRWLETAIDNSQEGECEESLAHRAEALHGVGYIALQQRDYDVAKLSLQKGLALFNKLNDKVSICKLNVSLGELLLWQGEYTQSTNLFDKNLILSREVQDKQSLAFSLHNLGLLYKIQGIPQKAIPFFQESLALFRELNNKRGIAITLANLGTFNQQQGNYEQANLFHQESLILHRELGDKQGMVIILLNLGETAIMQKLYQKAVPLLEEGARLAEGLGDKRADAFCSFCLGLVSKEQGNYDQALFFLNKSITLYYQIKEIQGSIPCLEELAAIAVKQGQLERGARLGGAVEFLRELTHVPVEPYRCAGYQEIVALLRKKLDESSLAKAWGHGREMASQQNLKAILE